MSTLRVNTLQNAAGTGQPAMAGAAKAWVNFNGTGTVAIRAAFNVSSITDNGTGDYTVNFTTAMVDTNYAAVGNSSTDGTYTGIAVNVYTKSTGGNAVFAPTTTALRMTNVQPNVGPVDSSFMTLSIFR